MTSPTVVGLHFGHDAAVAVIRGGEVLCCHERERFARMKHVIGLTWIDVERALASCGVEVADIDVVGVTTTQRIEFMFPDRDLLSFEDDPNPPGPIAALTKPYTSRDPAFDERLIAKLVGSRSTHDYIRNLSPQFKDGIDRFPTEPANEAFDQVSDNFLGRGLDELAIADTSQRLPTSHARSIKVTLGGRTIPGVLYSHHYAHAAYGYYSSGMTRAAIITQDGALPDHGYENGMFYVGEGHRVIPLSPHYLTIGHLYERVAAVLGFGQEAGPGKMMGLAPYGRPAFYHDRFVGNHFDSVRLASSSDARPVSDRTTRLVEAITQSKHPLLMQWVEHCLASAEATNYDFAPLGRTDAILERINVDIAASTQKLTEQTFLKAATVLKRQLETRGTPTDGLILSGGVALNCPTNSELFRAHIFPDVFVPPAVHDGGLAIGAAQALHHELSVSREPLGARHPLGLAYLGRAYSTAEIVRALNEHRPALTWSTCTDWTAAVARDLSRGLVVGLFVGRSEIGPRALGHRSILAAADRKENWERVNRIKGRELWRPFAPAVLTEEAARWFDGCPLPSPYMLFTAQVTSNKLPAITHVDGSARIQTVSRDDGAIHEILKAYQAETGIPVIMNTSFNGPGEPIVETPSDALRFLERTQLDVLYFEGLAVTRAN